MNLIDKHGEQGVLGRLWLDCLRNLSLTCEGGSSISRLGAGAPSEDQNRNHVTVEDFVLNGLQGEQPAANRVGDAGNKLESTDPLRIRYIWFDFHKKCKGGNVRSMAELYAPLQRYLEGPDAYFFAEGIDGVPDGEEGPSGADRSVGTVRLQRGVIRTNCIDCLDRTNVVQVIE